MKTDLILFRTQTNMMFQKASPTTYTIHQKKHSAREGNKPEILFVSSIPPRECGIATYSQDLLNSIQSQFENTFNCSICALETDSEQFDYETEPKYILNTDQRNGFQKLAFKINCDPNIQLVVFQHEFGFYHTKQADFAFLLNTISKPLVFVFHTVLPSPNATLKTKVKEIAYLAVSIIVMTENAKRILLTDYNIPLHKITVIPHGTHLVPHLDREKAKSAYKLTGRKVVATFGLLSSSKSIETTLDALPKVIETHPEVLFLILGKTHPNIVKQDGEVYREMLEEKVKTLKLEQHVRFVNEYLPLPTLLAYLQLTDIYLFTSKDPNQAVSGTFSYALSSGCPVISTPIPHAKEVLNANNGLIFDFGDSEALATAILSLLGNDALRAAISSNSFHTMAATAWQNSVLSHLKLMKKLSGNAIQLTYKIPPLNTAHVEKMTTSFGMIQFSKIAVPDLESGYTLDDNARALISLCLHFEITQNADDLILIHTYLQFIQFCQQSNGTFLNYVNTEKEFTAQNFNENLEDSNGRAIWALGYVIYLKKNLPLSFSELANEMIQKAVPNLHHIHSTRAMAFIIKGLHYQANPSNDALLVNLADRMVLMYHHEKTADWHWFESYLTYGNSLLPEAMLAAYLSTNNSEYKDIAKESFDFLLSKIFVDGKIKVISNKGWHVKDSEKIDVVGGEQPIDVAYTIMTLEKFYFVFQRTEYIRLAHTAFNWFLGENHLNQIVYNPVTGGCYDGVEEHNVNLNQGAESTLSYLLARLTIHQLLIFDQERKNYREFVVNIQKEKVKKNQKAYVF